MAAKTPNAALEDRGLLYAGERDGAPAEEIVGAMDLTGEEAGLRQAWRVFDGMRQIPLLTRGDDGLYRLTPEGLERAGILALVKLYEHDDDDERNEQ